MTGTGTEMWAALATLGVPPFVLADIGARGDIPEPWNELGPEALVVIGFEPDADESARLNAQALPGRTFLPVALWSSDCTVDIHLASTASCSSVHPPNLDLLSHYAARHGTPRDTASVVPVSATTLDAVVAREGLDIDFLKIDTQGAEYEILLGAEHTLRSQAIGALIETWTVDVHEDQHLSGEVMMLMRECGFELFDVAVAAAWQRRIVDKTPLHGKAQVIGLDLLFFKQPDGRADERRAKAAKLAAIAAIYGYPDFALEVARTASIPNSLENAILMSSKPHQSSFGTRTRSWVRRRISRRSKPTFPSLHT